MASPNVMAFFRSLQFKNVHQFILVICVSFLALYLGMNFITPPYSFKIKSNVSKDTQPTAAAGSIGRLVPAGIKGVDDISKTVLDSSLLALGVVTAISQKQTASKVTNTTSQPRRVQKCVHPKISVTDAVMLKHVKKPPLPICDKEEWLTIHNGTVLFSEAALKKYKNFACDYFPLIRESESKSVFGEPIKNISNGFRMVSDFFKGVCTSENGKENSVVYSGVHYNEERSKRSKNVDPLLSGFEGLGIAILGFDSMSRMSWLRRLKKTRAYFHDTMKGIELKGHNIVGDGTTAVVLPMLTGSFEWELPECRVNHKMATNLDKFPWVWRDLAKAGYLTSWCNADPYQAAFNWRMHGFKDAPTDFYIRPYYLAIRKRSIIASGTCDEGQTTSKRWLNYFRDIFFMYPQQRKFLFHFITDFSHDDNNHIMKMDDDIADVIRVLHKGNYLNNTLLILMGDHGARYPAYIRASWQGKMEERLPYFGFAFPPWFEKKYPHAIANLRTNTERLTTPFDLHETFKDFLYFQGAGHGDVNKRGISLFKEIPLERSCQQAGVADHWCACLNWKNVSAEDPGVQRAVRAVLDTLNNFTSHYRDDCAELFVQAVGMASKLEPRKEVLTYKGENLEDRKVDNSDKTKNSLTLYQLMLTTAPGGGQFEVTINHDLAKDKFSVSEKEISRINRYNNDPDCILQKDKSIRAYCYCKNKLKIT